MLLPTRAIEVARIRPLDGEAFLTSAINDIRAAEFFADAGQNRAARRGLGLGFEAGSGLRALGAGDFSRL